MGPTTNLRTLVRDRALAPAGSETWGGEDLYRDLVENAHDPIYCIDLEGNFTCVNRAALRVSGYNRSEALRLNIAHLVAPEHLDRARLMIQQTLRGESPDPYDLEIVTRDGRRVVLELTHRPILKGGFPIGTQSIAREITERRRAEVLEHDRMRVLEMIASRRPLPDIFEHLVGMVERQFNDVAGCLMLLREGRLHVAAAPNLPEEFARRINGVWASRSMGSAAVAAHLRRPVYSHDIANDPAWVDYRELALKHKLLSCWSLPIATGSGKLMGTLDIYHNRVARPDQSQLKFLQVTMRSAALAIEHRQMTEALAFQAHHDALTGLPNRTLFHDRMQAAITEAGTDKSVGVLYIDLDQFKLINDTMGHHFGDQLLRQVATRLRSCVTEKDTLARISGDEFVIIAADLSDTASTGRLADNVLQILRQPFELQGQEIFVTASIGISLYPRDAEEPEPLLQCADSAMYRAKHGGKNRYARFEPSIGAAQVERLTVENHLHRALERQEFAIHYQPQFDLKNGRLTGYEALLRWTHPKLGTVSPARFVPIAEQSGLIKEIGAWVLEQACRQARMWQRSGHPQSNMSVNVSAIQLEQDNFVSGVEHALKRTGLDPASLELEITESMLMRDVEDFVRKMQVLRRIGVRISVDDFGTGFSSLSYLQRLPIDILKLDRSFIEGVKQSVHGASLVRAVVSMAHGLGLRVTAEGIETQHQLEVVQESGCDVAQGYLLGRPKPADSARNLEFYPLMMQDRRRESLLSAG